MNKASFIKKYFKICDDKCVCLLCPINCETKYAISTNFKTLTAHLLNNHKANINIEEYNEICKISKYKNNSLIVECTKDQEKEYTNNIANLIIQNMLPFNIVESKSFRTLLSGINKSYTVPNRKTIKNYIENIWLNERDKKKKELNDNVSKIALTIDLWTSLNNISFLGISYHYIDNNWSLRYGVLDILELNYPHTAENINLCLMKCINEYKIDNKIIAVVSDNAANMINNGTLLKVKLLNEYNNIIYPIGCSCHIINLCINEGFKIKNNEIDKLRLIVIKLRSSPLLLDKIKKLVEENEENYYCPKIDNVTRWNSTYTMIKDILKMKKTLNDLQEIDITEIEWKIYESYHKILKQFNNAVLILEGSEYPTISLTYTVIEILKQYLNQQIKKDSFKDVLIPMLDKLNKYYNDYKEIYKITSFLDPSQKTVNIQKNEISIIKKIYMRYKKEIIVINKNSDNDDSSNENIFTKNTISKNEFNDYKKKNIEETDNILEWWKIYETKYPTLSKIARDFLCVPASSAPVERIFSSSGNIVTAKRNRLDEESIRILTALNSWQKEELK